MTVNNELTKNNKNDKKCSGICFKFQPKYFRTNKYKYFERRGIKGKPKSVFQSRYCLDFLLIIPLKKIISSFYIVNFKNLK